MFSIFLNILANIKYNDDHDTTVDGADDLVSSDKVCGDKVVL